MEPTTYVIIMSLLHSFDLLCMMGMMMSSFGQKHTYTLNCIYTHTHRARRVRGEEGAICAELTSCCVDVCIYFIYIKVRGVIALARVLPAENNLTFDPPPPPLLASLLDHYLSLSINLDNNPDGFFFSFFFINIRHRV